MRLIDADKLIDSLHDLYDWCRDIRKTGLEQAMSMVHEQPTIDVATKPIVMCGNCVHYKTDDGLPPYCGYLTDMVGFCDDAVYMEDNDFCSYGERRRY